MKNIKILLFVIFGLWSYNLISMEENSAQTSDLGMTVTTADNVKYNLTMEKIIQSQTLHELFKSGITKTHLDTILNDDFILIVDYLQKDEEKQKETLIEWKKKPIKNQIDLLHIANYLDIRKTILDKDSDNTLTNHLARHLVSKLTLEDYTTYQESLKGSVNPIKRHLAHNLSLYIYTPR